MSIPDKVAPTISLLCKLGSIVTHAQEALSDDGHRLDWVAMQALLNDPEVITWQKEMDLLALTPKKRMT